MTYTIIRFRPGIDIEQTPILLEAGFSAGQNIRFPHGLPEKIGGFTHLNNSTFTGTAREVWAWADLTGNPYVAVGTDQKLEVFAYGLMYDITPLRRTANVSLPFATTNNSNIITVTDNGHGAATGDTVICVMPCATSTANLIVYGEYTVSVTGANTYTIATSSNASATVASCGIPPEFMTTSGNASIAVTLEAYNPVTNTTFTVQIPTTVGGISLTAYGGYNIASTVGANSFYIAPGPAATSSQTVWENSSNVRLQYEISPGYSSVVSLSGYGIGPYGSGPYGEGGSSIFTMIRMWALDNWGADLIGNYTQSPIYVWSPPPGDGNVALAINASNFSGALEPPTLVNWSFVAMPQQIMVALGVDPFGGAQDPCLIRWSDIGDFTDWEPLATNQAGSFRLPNGSMIVGGLQTPQFACIWTDIEMWTMVYLGFPLVFGFQKVGTGVDLIGPNAAGVLEGRVFWASSNGFFVFDGNTITQVPCPVWDVMWLNLNRLQKYKIFAAPNSFFREMSWWYPSASGNGEVDSRVTLNISNGTWTFDSPSTFVRTAWEDENVYGAPLGADLNGFIQQHEQGYDADGAPLLAYVTSADTAIAEGDQYSFVERVLGDFVQNSGNVYLSVSVKDYANQTPGTYGPFTYSQTTGPNFSIVRARGRYASFTVSSVDRGVFWRLGGIHFNIKKAGYR